MARDTYSIEFGPYLRGWGGKNTLLHEVSQTLMSESLDTSDAAPRLFVMDDDEDDEAD